MPETTTVPADAQGAKAEPATQAQGAEAQQAQGASADKGGDDVESLRAKIAELERDNRRYREQAREALKAGEQSKSEAEQNAELRKRIAELEQRDREAAIAKTIASAAAKAGFRNPELAVSLVRDSIEVDEDGIPRHVDKALNDLLAQEPYLGKPTTPDAGGGPRGRTPSSEPTPNELLRAAIRGT